MGVLQKIWSECKFARYMGGFSLIPWEVQSLSRCTIAREIPRNVHILSHATSKFTSFALTDSLI